MGKMLNFSQDEKEIIKKFLSKFPRKPTKTKYEEMRVDVDGAIVTLYSTGKIVIQGKNVGKVKLQILRKVRVKGDDELILGIDETGRGESFGPFVVASVLGKNADFREFRDSKKTGDLKGKAAILESKFVLARVEEVPAAEIDRARSQGITMDEIEARIINKMIDFCLEKHPEAKIKIDGKALKGVSGKAEFIVKGDDKVPVIGAASVLAKITRERSKDKAERKSWKKGG